MAVVRTTDIIYEDSVAPTGAQNFAAGYRVGNDWRDTVTGITYYCTGDGVWINMTDSLSGSYIVIGGPIEIKDEAVLSPAQITSNQNDYSPSGWVVGGEVQVSVLVLNANGNYNLTGLEAPSPAKRMRLTIINNSATNNITFPNNSGSSLAINRFLSNGNITLNEKEALDFVYNPTELRWIPITN